MATKHFTRIFISSLFIAGLSNFAFAQRSQNVQENALWAPVPVKVDGKTNEVAFQASNKSTLLSYTLSNDDKNLYLVMKSADNMNNNKIMMGGITLTINMEGKKKEKEGYTITYPVIARQQRGQGGNRSQGGGFGGGQGGGQRTAGLNVDSATAARRKQQLATAKEIKISGFKDITDSLISIYNEYEISAAANFDEKGAFVYELAIPLKSLGLSPNSKDFAYNIKINGRQFGGGGNVVRVNDGGGGFGGGLGGGRGGFDPSMFLPTDFWGKYTLAKK
ncbi:MAG: hypothetical protein H7Y13_16530 [Sphingobacteriaceae bacterium]|nr:hypothetical protein [Sphingobacteriaceae bacterium]